MYKSTIDELISNDQISKGNKSRSQSISSETCSYFDALNNVLNSKSFEDIEHKENNNIDSSVYSCNNTYQTIENVKSYQMKKLIELIWSPLLASISLYYNSFKEDIIISEVCSKVCLNMIAISGKLCLSTVSESYLNCILSILQSNINNLTSKLKDPLTILKPSFISCLKSIIEFLIINGSYLESASFWKTIVSYVVQIEECNYYNTKSHQLDSRFKIESTSNLIRPETSKDNINSISSIPTSLIESLFKESNNYNANGLYFLIKALLENLREEALRENVIVTIFLLRRIKEVIVYVDKHQNTQLAISILKDFSSCFLDIIDNFTIKCNINKFNEFWKYLYMDIIDMSKDIIIYYYGFSFINKEMEVYCFSLIKSIFLTILQESINNVDYLIQGLLLIITSTSNRINYGWDLIFDIIKRGSAFNESLNETYRSILTPLILLLLNEIKDFSFDFVSMQESNIVNYFNCVIYLYTFDYLKEYTSISINNIIDKLNSIDTKYSNNAFIILLLLSTDSIISKSPSDYFSLQMKILNKLAISDNFSIIFSQYILPSLKVSLLSQSNNKLNLLINEEEVNSCYNIQVNDLVLNLLISDQYLQMMNSKQTEVSILTSDRYFSYIDNFLENCINNIKINSFDIKYFEIMLLLILHNFERDYKVILRISLKYIHLYSEDYSSNFFTFSNKIILTSIKDFPIGSIKECINTSSLEVIFRYIELYDFWKKYLISLKPHIEISIISDAINYSLTHLISLVEYFIEAFDLLLILYSDGNANNEIEANVKGENEYSKNKEQLLEMTNLLLELILNIHDSQGYLLNFEVKTISLNQSNYLIYLQDLLLLWKKCDLSRAESFNLIEEKKLYDSKFNEKISTLIKIELSQYLPLFINCFQGKNKQKIFKLVIDFNSNEFNSSVSVILGIISESLSFN